MCWFGWSGDCASHLGLIAGCSGAVVRSPGLFIVTVCHCWCVCVFVCSFVWLVELFVCVFVCLCAWLFVGSFVC